MDYLKRLARSYRKRWLNFTNLDKKENLTSFDFKKPWWTLFKEKKGVWFLILLGSIVARVVVTLLPILIKSAISSKQFSSFVFLFLVWGGAETFRYITECFSTKMLSSIIAGVRDSALKFFLTVDPTYHANRVTGEVFGKIERCSLAYEEFVNSSIYQILPIVVGVITVIVSFFTVNVSLGLIALLFVLFLITFNVSMIIFNGLSFERRVVQVDDSFKATSMESLVQVELVRSAFATNEVNKEIVSKSSLFMAMDGTYYISFFTIIFLTRFLYALSIFSLGLYIIYLVKQGSLTVLAGSTFLVTYLHGTYHIIKIGKRAQKFVRSIFRIKDLFSFVRKFGKQTFPVLKSDASTLYENPTTDTILIDASNLYFAYKDARIFDNHNLQIEVPQAQENKLYGIIGPSGVGKTTLISILGGQLHPLEGTVEVNEVPIYNVNDNMRRKLISLQGQSASSLRGTLQDNLLLGIPKGLSLFTKEYMIDVLKKVGVWAIFSEKQGLHSMIGEGALNLSGGQRQRLNFASLYLRTKYYKPFLVMIDEPTSSLDELSEQAITDMINELAKDALVFVIAHRLSTLDDAVGILDCSLLDTEKDMIFYSRDALMKKSEFYQKLRSGEVAIGE